MDLLANLASQSSTHKAPPAYESEQSIHRDVQAYESPDTKVALKERIVKPCLLCDGLA